jgi:tyrosyl-tRNA synthetase
MPQPDQKLYADLEVRGIIKQVTDPLLASVLSKESMTFYAGFDPTSDSLHIGSLLPLLTMKRLQMASHRPIAVLGGATGMIGDPSFKSLERTLMTNEQIEQNLIGIQKMIAKFLDFSGSNAVLMRNNADWYRDVNYITFLRDVGKHFTVNHMIAKESVRARLEDREYGISYTEFSYMLLQAYDFLILNEKENCRLQIGGSDQWGNITAGTELIRRVNAAKGLAAQEVYGLTHPLVLKADGTKFGKTEAGTIWLDAEKTSPFQFYQYFIQTADADAIQYLKFFTFLSIDEINALEDSLKKEPEKRKAQNALARELTLLVHGGAELAKAEGATKALFGAEICELDEKMLLEVLQGAPSTQKAKDLLNTGYTLIDALVDAALCSSRGAARKDITAGGIYVNNIRVTDAAKSLTSTDLIANGYLVLRKGKKNYHLLVFR